jgi:uncharacterized protein YvpB
MNKYFLAALALGLAAAAFWFNSSREAPAQNPVFVQTEPEADDPMPSRVNLKVPYVNEAPENIWTGSWKNACEEATIAMVEKYYSGIETVSISEAKEYLQMLFTVQQKEYGSDANSDAHRTLEIIKNHTNFDGRVVDNPTLDDIKKELEEGRPIIAFHHGFALGNKNIPFLPTGSSYHTTVIKGYDEAIGAFITNDPGDSKEGADHIYDYEVFMDSLHDYRYSTQKADGIPRVIFTLRK